MVQLFTHAPFSSEMRICVAMRSIAVRMTRLEKHGNDIGDGSLKIEEPILHLAINWSECNILQ